MATITNTMTLDGSTSFTSFGRTWAWDTSDPSEGWISTILIDGRSGADAYVANVTFSGDWGTRYLRFDPDASAPMQANITDMSDGGTRLIRLFEIYENVEANITLTDTQVHYFRGRGEGDVTLTLGTKTTSGIVLFDGNHTITAGSGTIRSMTLGDGDNTVVGIEGSRIDQARLGNGTNTVSVATDARIGSLWTGDGNDNITLSGSARIYMLKMGQGDNILTTDSGNVESVYSYMGNNTLNIGTGGVQQVVLSGEGGTHAITSDGYLGAVQVYSASSTTLTLRADAGMVRLGHGGNTISLSDAASVDVIRGGDARDTVTLATGTEIDTLRLGAGNDLLRMNGTAVVWNADTGAGNDIVYLGSTGGSVVNLGAGNDTVFLQPTPTNDETILRGGSGTDTLNLSGFKALGVTVSLETSNFQSLEDGQGYLSVSGFEKLLGTKRSDTMTGSDGGNETLLGGSGNDRLSGLAGDDLLQGQGGADKLRGGDGDDVLDGAAGRDQLWGGAGEDTFLFRARDGADTLMDFTAGEDHIQIIGAKSLSNINFDAKGADVEISYGKLSILVKDIDVATMQDADNFLF